jgi:uncharacterized membrane protein
MDTIRSRRLLLAGAVGLAPLLLAAGSTTFPAGTFRFAGTTPEARKALTATAAAPYRVLAASLLSLVGFVLLAVAFCAIATLVRRRGGLAATVGAAVGVIGSVGAVIVVCWLGLSVYAATQAAMTTDAKAAYVVSLLRGTHLGNVAGFSFLPGLVLGSLLMAVGLFRSRRVARWLAVGFTPAVIAATVSAPQGLLGGLVTLPLVAIMIMLAREVSRYEATATEGAAAAAVAPYAAVQ